MSNLINPDIALIHKKPTQEEYEEQYAARLMCGAISWDYKPKLDLAFQAFIRQYQEYIKQNSIARLDRSKNFAKLFNLALINNGTHRCKLLWKPNMILKVALTPDNQLVNLMELLLYKYTGNDMHKHLCPITEGNLALCVTQRVSTDEAVPLEQREAILKLFSTNNIIFKNALQEQHWGWLGQTPVLLNYSDWSLKNAESEFENLKREMLDLLRDNDNLTLLNFQKFYSKIRLL